MVISDAGRAVKRIDLLLVGILLYALLSIVHDGYDVLHLLVYAGKGVGIVVHLEDIAAHSCIEVKAAP